MYLIHFDERITQKMKWIDEKKNQIKRIHIKKHNHRRNAPLSDDGMHIMNLGSRFTQLHAHAAQLDDVVSFLFVLCRFCMRN